MHPRAHVADGASHAQALRLVAVDVPDDEGLARRVHVPDAAGHDAAALHRMPDDHRARVREVRAGTERGGGGRRGGERGPGRGNREQGAAQRPPPLPANERTSGCTGPAPASRSSAPIVAIVQPENQRSSTSSPAETGGAATTENWSRTFS